MEIDILKLLNEGTHPGVIYLIKSISLLVITLAIVVVPLYLASVVRLCFEEIRRPLHRRMKPAAVPPTPGWKTSRRQIPSLTR